MRIFISYAREDYLQAKRLYDALCRFEQYKPGLDTQNLLPDTDWKMEIFEAIESSQIVIVLLSDHSVDKRGFVQRELKKALEVFDCCPLARYSLFLFE